MSSKFKYTVLGYDRVAVEKCRGDVRHITGWAAERTTDSIKEAKRLARIFLSESWRVSGEMSERLVYASVHLYGEDGDCLHEEWNPDYRLPSDKEFAYEDALKKFVSTIEGTGGVIAFEDGTHGCAVDEDWIDLADAYLEACDALGRTPRKHPCKPVIESEETRA